MRFIFHYPETNGAAGDMLDAGPIHEVAAAAERAGFAGLSLTEHPIPGARWLEHGGHQSVDPLVGLAAAAAATTTLTLHTHLVVVPYRNPFLLAKAAATVDMVSDGRLILGVGVGYNKSEYFALGVDFEERNALFDEALDVLPLHWKGEPFSYKGLHFEARDVIARPAPRKQPIPIWIGGNSKLSRRRVAAKAQGWMPMMGSPELSATARTPMISSVDELAVAIKEVRQAAADQGRTDTIEIVAGHVHDPLGPGAADGYGELADAGVGWTIVSTKSSSLVETTEFLEAFGALHL